MKTTNRRIRISVVVAAFILAGCGFTTKQSQVEKGALYQTGDREYDAFFRDLHKMREAAESADERPKEAQAKLRNVLGLSGEATYEEALKETRRRAQELKKNGVLLHLELTPVARLVSIEKDKGGIDDSAEELLETVELTAKSALKVAAQLGQLDDNAVTLERRRADLLSKTDSELDAPPIKRGEVEEELDASEAVISDARSKVGISAGHAARFALALAQAVETGAGDPTLLPPPPKPEPPPPPAAPRPAWRPRPGTPPPKPPPSADFDP